MDVITMKGQNLNLSFGNEMIYEEASFEIPSNTKVGVVGVNGAGKTTLFRILLGEVELDSGNIDIRGMRIGHLPQEIEFTEKNMTVWDYIYGGRPIKELQSELTEIYTHLSEVDQKEEKRLLKRAAKIQDTLDVLDEYEADEDLLELIEHMQIDDSMLEMRVGDLSGGQKSKIAFAKLLFSNSDVLLLDEPTNHLDATTKDFVIDYLKNYRGTALIISHDIDFLNVTVDKIMFINKTNHKIKIYDGNYSKFKKTYAKEMAEKETRIVNQEREIERLQEIVKRAEQASRTNHKLKRLGESRRIQLEKKLDELETRDKEYKRVNIKIDPLREIGKVPLEVTNLTFGYPGKDNLYGNLSFTLTKNEKFLIVGENGIGKSTLLKLLVSKLTPKSGTISFNMKADVAYYAQELEILDENKTVLQNVNNPNYSELSLRSILGNFLFKGDDVYKKVNVLSPGEKARVALCKILLQQANFIILDEPTNHFDPETQSIIGENFKNYDGTLILVSHNPSFVEEIGITRMLVLPEGKILNYSKELLDYYYYLNTELM